MKIPHSNVYFNIWSLSGDTFIRAYEIFGHGSQNKSGSIPQKNISKVTQPGLASQVLSGQSGLCTVKDSSAATGIRWQHSFFPGGVLHWLIPGAVFGHGKWDVKQPAATLPSSSLVVIFCFCCFQLDTSSSLLGTRNIHWENTSTILASRKTCGTFLLLLFMMDVGV